MAEFGALVRRQLWTILLPFAFVTAIGVMLAQLMPRTYEVVTTVKIPETGIPGTNSIQRDVSSATKDIVMEPLVRSVIESQEWSDYIELTDKEKVDYVKRVIKNIKPIVSTANKNNPGSAFLEVKYRDADAQRAESFLNALRDRYIDDVVRAVRADAKARRDLFKELRDRAFAEYREAEKIKGDLIKQKNLSSTLPGSQGGRSEDPVAMRLTAATNELSQAESDLKEKQASLQYQERLLAIEPDAIPESKAAAYANAVAKPAVVDDVARQVREHELAILERREKLKDYRPAAKSYQRLEDEISKLESKIAMLKGDATGGGTEEGPTRFVPNPARAVYEDGIRKVKGEIEALQVRIGSLKSEITELKRENADRLDAYVQLSYLYNDVNRTSQNYLGADQAWSAAAINVQMLEGPEANPFDVVQIALASDEPIAPNVPVFIIVSVLLGLAGGLGCAITAEFLRNGFKGIPDLTRGLAVPVLGVVNVIRTRAEARRAMVRHAMIGASSLVIVGSILWITWAYQHDSLRLLGPQLTQVIEDMRRTFRP